MKPKHDSGKGKENSVRENLPLGSSKTISQTSPLNSEEVKTKLSKRYY